MNNFTTSRVPQSAPVEADRDDGVSVASFSQAGIQMENVSVQPNFQLRGHRHRHLHLCFVLQGGFEEVGDRGGSKICQAGHMRISKPNVEHQIHFGEASRCVVVELNSARFESALNDWPLDTENLFFDKDEAASFEQHIDWRTATDLPRNPMQMEIGVRQLLSRCFHFRRTGDTLVLPDQIIEAQSRVEEQVDIQVDQLAKQIGISRGHLSRLFNRFLGITPKLYIALHRLVRACNDLRSTAIPLSLVAVQNGYNDQSHFYKWFDRYFDLSPQCYRARYSKTAV